MSSFAATSVSAPSEEPVYAASTVSKPEPTVSKVAVPALGAVQTYQIECAAGEAARAGSFACFVAFTVVPVTRREAPESACGEPKLSFAGAAGADVEIVQFSVTEPFAPSQPSTA